MKENIKTARTIMILIGMVLIIGNTLRLVIGNVTIQNVSQLGEEPKDIIGFAFYHFSNLEITTITIGL